MKLIIRIALSILCVWYAGKSAAQLSPGDLAAEHAHLEGLSNCTQCHEIGKKVTNQKCLDCHTALQSRLNENRGYHASSEILGKECIECHSDHHGRKFEMIRFDETTFDHDLTGYQLEGAHQKQECRQCHTTAFIIDNEIRKKEYTYLGLDTDCLNCHDDYHQRTLSFDCRSCHDMQAFTPAPLFDHNESAFPLKGRHKVVDCASCHQIETVNEAKFQHFAGIEFDQCSDCHDDVHQGRFGNNCTQCHTEESFQTISNVSSFNHRSTGFPLLGQHSALDCKECHDSPSSGANAFREFEAVNTNQCSACHDDVHEGKFGLDCKSCHSENGFQIIQSSIEFDHTQTDFALEGKHEAVDCKACHAGAMTDPVPFARCTDCHADEHDGQFTATDPMIDCAACHTVEDFSVSTFTISRHAETAFPLEGAHIATPCFTCHLQEDKWVFKSIGSSCVDCHEDIHLGYIDNQFYPEGNCTDCHSINSWSEVAFDHTLTDFDLEGRHSTIDCASCHIDETEEGNLIQTFADLSQECSDCHDDQHFRQFDIDESTDCFRCHGFEHWEAEKFDHDSTQFVLEGEHLLIKCNACHKETTQKNETYILYKIESHACIDCHR
jgi:hypothetical protein